MRNHAESELSTFRDIGILSEAGLKQFPNAFMALWVVKSGGLWPPIFSPFSPYQGGGGAMICFIAPRDWLGPAGPASDGKGGQGLER